jgi:hypothetical protein
MGDFMKDDHKTKKQLVDELTELRSQNAVLNQSITRSISAELAGEEARRRAGLGKLDSDISGKAAL